jgi:hypothetical protein
MTKRSSAYDGLMDNAELQHILKRYDPVEPPTQGSLMAIEASIFAKIDGLTRNRIPADSQMPPWVFLQGWAGRVAIFTALLIIASGFIVGQLSYGETNVSALTSTPSLLALADETLGPAVPVTDTSWGDNDDAAE